MGESASLKNHFLIATPSMKDPNFYHGVIYICEHSLEGAMGIVVNLPLNVTLGDIFDNMQIHSTNPNMSQDHVFAGGPVHQEIGFVLHKPSLGKWQSSLKLKDDIVITTSKDILEATAHEEFTRPSAMLLALGYAAWSPGQLEQELKDNSWLVWPASSELLFDTPPEDRWLKAGQLMGVDFNNHLISTDIGHA